MSQKTFTELIAFDQVEASKAYPEQVCLARVLDFDIHKTRWPDTLGAFQMQEDCVQWGVDHSDNVGQGNPKVPNDGKPGNMKVRVYARNHTPKGVSPWLDLEQVAAWKAGKIQE